ncbi:unnamed protein product, partial [Rangifer tarandus platyrhynchus]
EGGLNWWLFGQETDFSDCMGPHWVLIALVLSVCLYSVQRSQSMSGLFTIWLFSCGCAS